MLIELIILLLIFIICYKSILISIHDRCLNDRQIKINFMQAFKLSNYNNNYILPTIKVLLDKEIPCGVYLAQTKYGIVTLFVGYYNRKECKVYYHNKSNNIYNDSVLYFFNIEKIIDNSDPVIRTFNSGCCKIENKN